MTYSERTFSGLFEAAAARHRAAAAIRFRDGAGTWREWTYAELAARVERVARGLAATGLRRGDRVALISDARPQWTVVDLAAARAGLVTVPLHPESTRAECQHVLSHCGARMAVVETDEHLDLVRGAHGTRLQRVVALAATGGAAPTLDELAADAETWAGPLAAPTPDDPLTILYTSGTTGSAKGCVHTNASYSAALRATAWHGSVLPGDVSLLHLPLAHAMGREVQSLTLIVGGCVVFPARGRSRVLDDLHEVRPTFFAGTPRLYEKAYALATERRRNHPPLPDRATLARLAAARLAGRGVAAELDAGAFASVRELFGGRLREAWCGAAPLARPVLDLLVAAGVPVHEGYGMTETAAAVTLGTAGNAKLGTVGRPLPGVELRIEDGEILVRGPSVFRGYHRDGRATSTVLRDGWLRTGDLGRIDHDGFLTITGRRKELIATSTGEHVVPGGWEDELRRSWCVGEAVMVGDGRPFLTALIAPDFAALRERLGATAGTRTDAELARDASVVACVAARVEAANASRPRWARVRRFAVLPRALTHASGELTASGKVRRGALAELHAERIDALYGAASDARRRPDGA